VTGLGPDLQGSLSPRLLSCNWRKKEKGRENRGNEEGEGTVGKQKRKKAGKGKEENKWELARQSTTTSNCSV